MKKIRSLMKAHQLDKVFVATDAIRKGRQFSSPARVGCWAGAGIRCVPPGGSAASPSPRRAGRTEEAATGNGEV